ncbi:MAG: PIN domain-containing protein [Solirubrobacterales bacterium]|nr:PIN domain-containing protein [Solirubrobacterales bacterium]
MLLDANLLLYAVHERAEQHEQAATWMTEKLNGPVRIGFPWQSINAFLRISTHPRAFQRPLAPPIAWERVTDWLASPVAWVPQPGPEYPQIYGGLIATHNVHGNLIPDAALAALAIEHGVTLASTDTDFVRFHGLRWENPLEEKPR